MFKTMRKSLLSFLFVLPGILPLVAQNYQTIRSDRTAYYYNQGGYVSCIRIDSFAVQSDSVFYPFLNLGQTDYGCYTPYGTPWIGKKILVQQDGYTLFFNKANDTIKIKTNASLNENWTAYKLKNSTIIVAEVTNIDTLGFLGMEDSVKTIGFKVYDKSMNPVTHPLNDMTILLSKNFGLVQTFNFKLFPALESGDFPYEPFQEYDLAGLTNPQKGLQNITWFQVHDFQVGDEIHTEYETGSFGYDRTTVDNIETYLERTDYTDSIIYRIDRRQSIHRTWPDNETREYKHDTIRLVIRQNPEFDKLPGEPVVSDYLAYSNSMYKNNYNAKSVASLYESIWPSSDSCWAHCCVSGCSPYYTYIKGLGGPYYECESSFDIGKSELLYYKKGLVTWGTPLIISGLNNHTLQKDISVYPNPARDRIWIEVQYAEFPFTLELTDINGKSLLRQEINYNNASVDVRELGKGMFLFRLQDKNGVIRYGKLILE